MTWHASSQLLMNIDLLNVAPPPSPDSVLGSVPISRTSRHHAPAPATASPPVVSSAPSRNATAKVQTGVGGRDDDMHQVGARHQGRQQPLQRRSRRRRPKRARACSLRLTPPPRPLQMRCERGAHPEQAHEGNRDERRCGHPAGEPVTSAGASHIAALTAAKPLWTVSPPPPPPLSEDAILAGDAARGHKKVPSER